MPFINPGIVGCSPFLADTFSLQRQTETVGANGRVTITPVVTAGLVGIVTQAGRNDLERLDDSQRASYVISVISQTPMRGPTPGAQPDVVKWRGTDFLVIKCLPNPQFGEGWYKTLAGSQTAIDPLPTT